MNPFIVYRSFLDSYRLARSRGWSDAAFVALVERLDAAVAEIEGKGFTPTPLVNASVLGSALGLPRIWVKDETGNVSGSHKARHLFGVMLHLAIETDSTAELAIASCGNAALAAAVVAAASRRPLRVFIPDWADSVVVNRLQALGAAIEICQRRPGEKGDPTYLRFLEAITRGAIPFSVQGTVTKTTLDGGRTLGWELASQLAVEQVAGPVRLIAQVGGGALASAAWQGLQEGMAREQLPVEARLHVVQPAACAPLIRAWEELIREVADEAGQALPAAPSAIARWLSTERLGDRAIGLAQASPDHYMRVWEPVGRSLATGLLDDVTYDWLTVLEPMIRSGGWPVAASEEHILLAADLASRHTHIDVDATGAAGVAGLLDADLGGSIPSDGHCVVLFTGARRS